MQKLLERLIEKHLPTTRYGKCAEYIPVLAEQDPSQLGITVVTKDQKVYQAGRFPKRFTLQSISKVIALMLAVMDNGDRKVFSKVGMEPTGDPFNSIYNMEMMKWKKPLNPMINAGALVVTSLIKGRTAREKAGRIIRLIEEMTGSKEIEVDEEVFRSEYETAHRNRALAHLLKELNLIDRVEETLEAYLLQCSIQVTCEDLAKIGLCLARYGQTFDNRMVIPVYVSRMAKTFMVTCGMYNESGEFAIKVGIPAKSGVSGGILASVPMEMGIGVFGPALNEKGNSIGGVALLEDLSRELDLSIF
ncbi:glutaminase A [Thermoactinomyces intermedius]|jgi:glutaminase|uniref:Glutaminase n=1 Tax=Thermoactinomyces intermedius TaxID=2024 RepID=A0A8I1A1L7_THEIN|nr:MULTISPECIES: glutaminase A [Thermoactinomyces]MBA4547947.1 glutaminase A [Thermoactinomyces intermedius]MBA4835973.1 glutaminase A [Thermoactinomyces intermedius]MBH8593822.1 glutaminase A [Thermoactinomyces intermedius]MBH8599869.1 glutaminase A [Thermoactinomyces sp. CICC 23799]